MMASLTESKPKKKTQPAAEPASPWDAELRRLWPAGPAEKLITLATPFPAHLRKAFVDVFLKGEANEELDDYLKGEPTKTDLMLEALQLEGQVTLGHSSDKLREIASTVSDEAFVRQISQLVEAISARPELKRVVTERLDQRERAVLVALGKPI
jgi:hypothetical protein